MDDYEQRRDPGEHLMRAHRHIEPHAP